MSNQTSETTVFYAVLQGLGFAEATVIQQQVMPVLSEGRSVFALAPTGSGKTLAFLIPLMKRMDASLTATQLLVVTPTRELGHQVAQVALQVSSLLAPETGRHFQVRSVFGGQKCDKQKAEILKKPEVVVATPGRAIELIRQGVLELSLLKAFVLDEADLMLGMGFESQIKSICDHLPNKVQAALFSATDSEEQTRLHNRLVHRGLRIDVRSRSESEACNAGALPERISHECVIVPRGQDKTQALIGLLKKISNETANGIIFCQTRESVHNVLSQLNGCGFSAVALSGELGQIERSTMLRRFKSGGVQYLVATNIAARGLDVSDLSVVVHYEVPSTQQEYMHRSGRSGRAGKRGRTISLCTPKAHEFLRELLQGTEVQLTELNVEFTELTTAVENSDFVKVHINRGKSSKVRPGDVLGTLTQHCGLSRTDVGGIFIFDHFSHVEVTSDKVAATLRRLSGQRMKNLPVKVTLAETLAPARSRSF